MERDGTGGQCAAAGVGQVVVGSGSSKGAGPAKAQGLAGLGRPPSQRLFANSSKILSPREKSESLFLCFSLACLLWCVRFGFLEHV
jgi:hypothetical protein